jgi:hypothetical protein
VQPPLFGDIMENQHGAGDSAGVVPDGGRAVLNGNLATVAGEQGGVVGQRDGLLFAQDAGDDVLARRAGFLVDNAEDTLCRLAQDYALRPAGEGFGDGIEEGDLTLEVGHQHGVANAGEGHAEVLALLAKGLPGLEVAVNFDLKLLVGLGEFVRARRDYFLQVVAVKARVGLGLCAPDIFLLEEKKDRDEQEKAQNAAGHQGLDGFASLGVAGLNPLLEHQAFGILRRGDLRADLVHRDFARVRSHDRQGGWQALGTPQFDGFPDYRLHLRDEALDDFETLLLRGVPDDALQVGQVGLHDAERGLIRLQVLVFPGEQVSALAGLFVLQRR